MTNHPTRKQPREIDADDVVNIDKYLAAMGERATSPLEILEVGRWGEEGHRGAAKKIAAKRHAAR